MQFVNKLSPERAGVQVFIHQIRKPQSTHIERTSGQGTQDRKTRTLRVLDPWCSTGFLARSATLASPLARYLFRNGCCWRPGFWENLFDRHLSELASSLPCLQDTQKDLGVRPPSSVFPLAQLCGDQRKFPALRTPD